MTWHTTAQVAAMVHRDPCTIRRAAESGLLHGHQPVDAHGHPVPGSRWTFADTAVDAWIQGLDQRAQREACGCARLRAVRRTA